MTARADTTAHPDSAGRAEPAGADGSGLPRPRRSLSPSRAADFKTCPLLYRFRTIDRLPERRSPDQVRGSLVHAVLERLFDLPADERTPQRAAELVEPAWHGLVELDPASAELFESDPAGLAEFLASAEGLLGGYFAVEDPRRLEPAEREFLVEAVVDTDLVLRGYLDRLDVAPDGALRVVDYKTGGAPRAMFEARALFQLKFYALVLWRLRGTVPRVLRLLYLKDAEVLDFTPDEQDLVRFERTLIALRAAIERATAARDFRPAPSRLCDWCDHQARCPAFGNEPPPFPELADPTAAAPVQVDPVPVEPGRLPRQTVGERPLTE